MQRPWSLYNKEEKLRIDDLKPEHVRIILLAIPTVRMGDWYACMEGDLHWAPIGSIPEFYEDVRQIKGQPASETAPAPQASAPLATPPQEKRRPLFEDAPSDMKTDPTLQVENSRTKERRTARRYARNLNFKVALDGKVFACETVDVSMTGMSLERELPSWAGKTFKAELNLNKTTVRIVCSRVSDTKLKITDAESWDVIRQWIVNW